MPLNIIKGDIAKVAADALVNAANSGLQEGGGVCGAIFRAAGQDRMKEACDAIGFCPEGQAVLTPAFGLNAKYVIHAVGPVYLDGLHGEPETLRGAYQSAMSLAKEKGLRSIAFPLISSGIYGYPRRDAQNVATGAILDFLRQDEDELSVTLVLFDGQDIRIDEKIRGEIEQLIRQSDFSEAKKLTYRIEESRNSARSEQFEFLTNASDLADLEEIGTAASPTPREASVKRQPKFARQAPISSLEKLIGHPDEGFSVTLLRLIDQKDKNDVEVYKRANIDRKLFSKIRGTESYTPSKKTALALAIALELNREETEDLLDRAGYSLSSSRKFDIIIGYFIDRAKYDIYDINDVLLYYDQPLLGA